MARAAVAVRWQAIKPQG